MTDAEIVDEAVAHDLDHAGIGVDLDLGDVAAVGEGRGRAVADVATRRGSAAAPAAVPARHGSAPASSMMPTERSVPAMTNRPRAEFDVGGRRLQHMRGDLLAVLDHLVAGLDDRGAARHHRFGAAGAAAGDQLVAVALQQADPPERDAEPARQHLGERRGVALAVIERAGDDRHVAVLARSGCRPSRGPARRSVRDSRRCRARAAGRAPGSPPCAPANPSQSASASALSSSAVNSPLS